MSQSTCQTIQKLEKALDGNNTNLSALISRMIEYEISCLENQNALCQRGISSAKQAVDWIAKANDQKSKRDLLAAYADDCLKEYQLINKKWSHKERRELLERNIRMLLPELESNDLGIQITLAKTYLYRSLLYRPKGRTEPARKIEALKKAARLAEKTLSSFTLGLTHDRFTETDVWRLWAQATIELYRISDELPQDFIEKMENVTLMIDSDMIIDINDIFILLIYSEKTKEMNAFDDSFINLILEESRDWGREYDLLLAKARAYILLEQFAQAAPLISEAINKAPKAFSDPYWNDLIDVLAKLRHCNDSHWQPLAIQAYEKCKKKELEMTSNIPLRWYWARQKNLYDLAFLASDSIEKKAEIADAVKSRPVLRYNTLHALKDKYKGIIDDILDQEDEARDGRYLKQNPIIKHQKRDYKTDTFHPHDQVPKPWIVVHFYINDLEKKGHALIYQSHSEQWFDCKFDYQHLQKAFLAWQEPYILGEKSEELKSLGIDTFPNLCQEIGHCMPFLFDPQYFPKKIDDEIQTNVLFIPHGFLHRLPFHATIKDYHLFLHHHVCRYLPAWHMATYLQNANNINHHTHYLMKFSDYKYNELKKLDWNETNEHAGAEDIQLTLNKKPSVLTLLCHGKGDILNPFKSKLLFNPSISLLDILKTEADMKGALVLLGACESDMAPPSNHQNILDEHLSMASVFLLHGAKEVVASLWRVQHEMIELVFHDVMQGDDPAKKIQAFQEEELDEWVEENGDGPFYDPSLFRVIGFPFLSPPNK